MKYGQISVNPTINLTIYRCFDHISEEDAEKFLKKFKDQPHDQVQIMHTFRELIAGAYLAAAGLNVKYDYPIRTKTPDWSIFNQDSLQAAVEVTNFHTDNITQDSINKAMQARGKWADWLAPNNERLYQSIWDKASIYKTLVESEKIAYVIAVFGEFEAAVEWKELNDCLFGEGYGLFQQYAAVSGVLFFTEGLGGYVFTYLPNPNSLRSIHLRSDIFLSDIARPSDK